MNNISKNKIILSIIFIAFLFTFQKFFISNFFFPNEENFLRLIFETKGASYLPIIKTYSEFNFNPFYSTDMNLNHTILSFPYLAVFIHSLLLKILGPFSIILIEFLAIIIFLLIFYQILLNSNFSSYESIVISCFLLTLPVLINDLVKLDLKILYLLNDNFKSFYGTRIPRPIITNLYFFLFILILLKLKIDEKYTLKKSILLGLSIGLSLHSFFYFFLIECFSLILFIFVTYKKNLFKHLYSEKKFYFLLISIVTFFLLLFLLQMNITNKEHLQLIGVNEINLSQKINLIKYLFIFLKNKMFLFLFFINLFLFFYIKKKENNLTIFYLIYLGSIFSFIFFIIFSNKSIHYYFFQNWIIINGLLFFILCFCKIVTVKLNNKIINYKNFLVFLLIVNIFYYNISFNINYNKFNQKRVDANNTIKIIKNDELNIKKTDKILVLIVEFFLH